MHYTDSLEILLFHGLAAGPESLAETSSLLRKQGWKVQVPFMKSYASTEVEKCAATDWLAEAEHACREILGNSEQKNLVLAGHSLGGSLCAHLLNNRLPERLHRRIKACAFLATPAGIDGRFLQFWDETSKPELNWPFSVLTGMLQFLRQTDYLFKQIKIPSIIIHGGKDHHIPPWSGLMLKRNLTTCPHHYVFHPDADHFFVNRNNTCSQELRCHLVDFIRKITCNGK